MNNGPALCARLREIHSLGDLSSPFKFEDVLRIAKSAINATPTGQKYAALTALQSCCISNEPEFDEFKTGDPRKFRNIMDVKKKWEFTLIDSSPAPTRKDKARVPRPGKSAASTGTGLSDEEARNLIRETFKAVANASALEELDRIVSDHPLLRKNAMSERKYPKLHFQLNKSELEELRKREILDADGNLNLGDCELSALEKLLYALAWKNGDLGKERHIVRGVNSSDSGAGGKEGLVFFYFGRHLADKSNPIVDQHVIRSFRLHELSQKSSQENLTAVRANEKVDEESIQRYVKWLGELNDDLRSQPGYRFHVDKVLFALGKAVKAKQT
jgi:hypothetical protein